MSDTCQVDFYVLSRDSQTAERLACRLALMAWEQGKQIAVLTENADEVQKLDALMWDYPPGRFLPHSTNFSDPSAPVRIPRLPRPGTATGQSHDRKIEQYEKKL